MKKINFTHKLVLILMLTIFINTLMVSVVNADYDPTAGVTTGDSASNIPKFESPLENPDNYKPGQLNSSPVTTKVTSKIVKWIRDIGVIVGVLMLTLVGFKYMLASGADEKAQYKETLVPIVIGAVMLLGSIGLIITIARLFD